MAATENEKKMKPELETIRIIAKALFRAENVTEAPADDAAREAQQQQWQEVKKDYDAKAKRFIGFLKKKGVTFTLAH
jgi:hypothetical protein